MFRVIRKIVLAYFAATGLLAHIALVIGFFAVLNYFDLTPSQFLYKAAEKSGLDIPWAVEALSPAPQFADHVMDGHVRPEHPRIILPALDQWDGQGMPGLMRKRVARYERQGMEDFDPCESGGGVMALAACWVSSGDTEVAERLRVSLKNFQIQTPDVQARYGNAWQLALAYDLLSLYPALDDNDRAQLEAKIEYALREYLTLLDDPSPSLWHGRTSLAAMAWLCAVVLDPAGSHQRPQLIARAQGHFLDVVRAAELTEGWPEGYNYWIQNRAFVFTLAASAYLNGLEDAANQARIRKLLRRIGLWHIYATRPDNRIEGLGDEGSRVDLKDETRRVVDVIAQATQDPVFATFSRYLEGLHRHESYYRGYRWGFRLFNDPTLDVGPNDGEGLAVFASLPQAELFGRGGLNLAYIHSDWSPDETFISFRAGQTFTHHGHYDAGHFSLFKQAPLAINSSTYDGNDFTSPHRLNYAIRTVAKNSLLILRPGEKVQPNKFFTRNVADGGQRVIIPTGSGVRSVADWAANRTQGKYFAGGQVESFDYKRDRYAYISADLTKAYNTPEHDEGGRGGKVRSVQRELVYLFDEDRLIVHDSVVSTEADYTKKWLLHTVNRPNVATEKVLIGSRNNGISESHEAVATVKNGKGYLRVDRLYPEDAVIRLVGGPDYQFYVESDGDDSDLDGDNFTKGMSLKPWFDVGMWRIEIQPGAPRLEDEFLMVLTPGKPSPRKDVVRPLSLRGTPAKGLATPKHLVVFLDHTAHGELQIPSPGKARQLLVFGVPANMRVELQGQSSGSELRSNTEGVLALDLGKGGSPVTVRW